MSALLQTTPNPAVRLPWLTVDRALFATILLVGALVRVVGLADRPLGLEESVRALAAWQLGSPTGPEWWDAPAFVALTAAVFFIAGASDAAARALPLAAGLACIASLWLFRPWLGVRGVLIAAAVLALSPASWAMARSTSEDTLAVLMTLWLLWGIIRFSDDYHPLYRPLTATGIALLLNLGAPGFTGMLALALGAVAVYAVQPQGLPTPLLLRVLVSRPFSRALVPFLSGFVLLSTGFLLYFKGFGLPSISAWVHATSPSAGRFPWYESWLLLSGYELPVLVVGVPAACVFLARWVQEPLGPSREARGLWAVWAVFALALLLLGGQPNLSAVFMASFPLSVVAAVALGDTLEAADRPSLSPLPILLVALVFLCWFGYMSVSHSLTVETRRGFPLAAILAGIGVLVVLALTVAGAWRPRVVLGALGVLAALGFSVQGVSLLAQSDLRPLEARTEASAVRAVTDRVRLSRYTEAANVQRIAIEAELRPVYAWQLREVPGVSFVRVVQAGPDVVVASQSTTLPAMPEYTRSEWTLTQSWVPQQWTWPDIWRWAVWGQAAAASKQDDRIVVLVRS